MLSPPPVLSPRTPLAASASGEELDFEQLTFTDGGRAHEDPAESPRTLVRFSVCLDQYLATQPSAGK